MGWCYLPDLLVLTATASNHVNTVSAPHSGGPPFRGSAIPDSEAKTNLYKGSVVTVSASYRPSSKVVGCGGGVWGPDKKYFYIPVQQ